MAPPRRWTEVSPVATANAAATRATVASSCSVSRSALASSRRSRSATEVGGPTEQRGQAGHDQGDSRDEAEHPHHPSPSTGTRSTSGTGPSRDDRATMSAVSDTGVNRSPERMSPWAPLRHTVFAALFAAQLGSNIGTFFQTVAAAWLMGDLTSSPTLVALIQTASLLPLLLLGLPAGALADIFDRRLLLIGTQAWMLSCAALLAVLTMTDHVTPSTLLALTFALGVGAALMGPAWQAIQPDLVPQREFGQAVALSSLTFNAGRAIGPALAGVLVASAGPGWAFIVNAASFLGVVVVLVWWRPHHTGVRLSTESLPGAVRAGLRYGVNAPALRGILGRTLVFAAPAAAIQALLPTVVRDQLGLGSGGYGILLGCFGIGAALAAVVRPRIDALLTSDQSVTVASVVVAVALVLVGTAGSAWAAGPALFFAGAGWTTATVTLNVATQRALPWWVRARGLGLYLVVLAGGIAIGSAVWGAVAGWSIAIAQIIAAVFLVAGIATSRRWRLDVVHGLDLRPATATAPIVVLEPAPEDGPVLVTVSYRVPAGAHVEFVEMMRSVERDRRRGGAQQWGLYRDLADTDRFVETFEVATWGEHLRQHQRRTRNGRRDAAAGPRVRRR
jgi:MFS family permease